jgi:hypothetical protein
MPEPKDLDECIAAVGTWVDCLACGQDGHIETTEGCTEICLQCLGVGAYQEKELLKAVKADKKPCMDGVSGVRTNSKGVLHFYYHGICVGVTADGVGVDHAELTWQQWRNLHAITEYYLTELENGK